MIQRIFSLGLLFLVMGCAGGANHRSNDYDISVQLCEQEFTDPRIDPIRSALPLWIKDATSSMKSNDSFVTAGERPAVIAYVGWAKRCNLRFPADAERMRQIRASRVRQLNAAQAVGIDLYEGRLSYGQYLLAVEKILYGASTTNSISTPTPTPPAAE